MRNSVVALMACAHLFVRPEIAADASDLGWLEGSWADEVDGMAMEEQWTSASGGALLGMHRDVVAGRMSSFEFLRIQTTAEGTFYYASPRSAVPVAFKLIESNGRSVLFENAQHDFPQRIRYWLDASDVLHARIEGTLNGKPAAEEWAWRRVTGCASPAR